MEEKLNECDHQSQCLLDNIKTVMNTFEKQSERFQKKENYGNRASSKTESQPWSVDSRPVTFAKSHENNECDFQYVETVLPKFSSKAGKKGGECEDDCFSDGSQSHTVFTIAKLVSNLNKQKEENKRLEEQIECLKSELAAANMRLQLEQCKRDDFGELSMLAEEIRMAERERESAVLSRLKLAIQHRDEAQLKVKAYFNNEKSFGNKQSIQKFGNKNLPELLDGLCHSASARAVEKHGSSILALLIRMRDERKQISEEEMGVLIQERDQALHQCLNLNEKIKENKAEISKLTAVSHDLSISTPPESCELQDLDRLRLNYSLLRSLQDRVHIDDAERLVEALRVAEEHRRIQEANNRRSEEQIKNLLEKNQRLERLVVVLRNKLTSMVMN